MPSTRSLLPRMLLPAALAGVLLALLSGVTAPSRAVEQSAERHEFVTSFDGTQLRVNFFRATGLATGERAPVVLIAHGFGESGPADPDAKRLAGAPTLRPVLDAGYHVVTWDARGHGDSEGMAMLDSPDFEVRDTRRIISWIAEQPGVRLDGTGDPRVGMVGASYGGIIQFLTAAVDKRIDVISPGYTAHDLADTSLSTNGKFKEGWGLALAGMAGLNLPAGLASPLGPQLHLLDPEAVATISGGVFAGRPTSRMREYLDPRSPSFYLDKITQPTLIQAGTSDTLFPLETLGRDLLALKRRGVPVKMVWNCEGHSLCPGATGPLEDHFNTTVINWMDRWLRRDRSVDTGPQFEWIADNEARYRSAPAYPAPTDDELRGVGSGRLALLAQAPLTSPGFVFLGAQPAAGPHIDVPIKAPSSDVDVVGAPTLRLTYAGRALPRRTWLYAQVLDKVTGRVVGVQATPVPIVLDGREHTVGVKLNEIASRATPSSAYVLQLMPGSLIFGLQRSTGLVNLRSVEISLPFR